jgi:hypothetical protein
MWLTKALSILSHQCLNLLLGQVQIIKENLIFLKISTLSKPQNDSKVYQTALVVMLVILVIP